MSVLCSTDVLLIIETKKNRPVTARCWEKVESGDHRTQGYQALRQLDWNASTLSLNADGIARLEHTKKHYNQYSHCGAVTIASRVQLDGPGAVHVGGNFALAKIPAYRSKWASGSACAACCRRS